MALAKTLTTPNGGGFVFQPAEPRAGFPTASSALVGWRTQGDETDARTTLRPDVQKFHRHRSALQTAQRCGVRVVTMEEPSARVGMKRLFRSGR